MSRIHRLIVVAGTVLAVAVIVPGPANARIPADAVPQQDLRSPDARDVGAPSPAGTPSVTVRDLRSPDARDAAGRTAPVVVRVERTADPGLRWDSMGLGALVTAGLLLALGGAVVLVGRHRGHGPHVA
jgi:hypothetical protein